LHSHPVLSNLAQLNALSALLLGQPMQDIQGHSAEFRVFFASLVALAGFWSSLPRTPSADPASWRVPVRGY
jgi:hypothetical protein